MLEIEFPKYNVIAVLTFVVIIMIAHFVAVEGYNWKINTVSELASQGYSRKWIMQIGFIIFALILLVGIIKKVKEHTIDYLIDIPIGLYGLAILVSGIYCTKPFISEIEYSEFESNIHSISATFAGIAFSIAILVSGIKENENPIRLIHFAFLIFVIGMSTYFGISLSNSGLIQKIMYLGSLFLLI